MGKAEHTSPSTTAARLQIQQPRVIRVLHERSLCRESDLSDKSDGSDLYLLSQNPQERVCCHAMCCGYARDEVRIGDFLLSLLA